MSVEAQRVLIAVWLVASLLMIPVAVLPSNAHANGRVVEFESQIAGPYEVALGTIPNTPAIGNVHLTMTIADASSGTFVMNADIAVSGRGPEANAVEVGPLAARNSPTSPIFYDATASVDREGTWTFTVAVSADLGDAHADFQKEIRKASPLSGIIMLLTLLAFLSILGLSVCIYLRERGRSRRSSRRKA